MRRKIMALFLCLCFICFGLTYFIVNYIDSIDETIRKGQELVNHNDIIKNAEKLLESSEDSALTISLEENGIALMLYDANGKIIYDSDGTGNIGQQEDINKLLGQTKSEKQVYIINYIENQKNQVVIAILENKEKLLLNKLQKEKVNVAIWSLYAVFTTLLAIVFLIIYRNVLHPFKNLEQFACEVAKGNLENTLIYPRQNIFGAFTWSFDMLRKELKISKQRQADSERTKKELVAVLSHDIRTPIASIKAYAECLSGLSDKNTERSERYVNVIIQKADELTKLSQDMFLHAISDLEKLEIIPSEYKSRELINNIIEPLILHYENRIRIIAAIPDVNLYTDRSRLAQIFENIISNAVKYAPNSEIQIEATIQEETLICRFTDKGKGVSPEDLPFIFDKFYRGKNAKESSEPGSGLGLYICKHILEKMGGTIKAYNYYEKEICGFVVEIALKISKSFSP